MTYPSWWGRDVRVIGHDGQTGVLMEAGNGGWLVQLDGDGDAANGYVVQPEAMSWRPEVRQRLTRGQLDRVTHDTERALLRAFGCHYVPEFEALPESTRAKSPHPRAVNRGELDGLQAIVRGAVWAALAPYATES
jgi:hypothetical protein